MTSKQALELLDSVVSKVPAARDQHALLIEALKKLAEDVKKLENLREKNGD